MTPAGEKIKTLLITPNYACGSIGGSCQRTDLIFRALKSAYDVDVLIVGSSIGDSHRNAFPGAKRVYEATHSEPGELGIWKTLRPFNPKLVDKIATAISPRRQMYNPEDRMIEFIRSIDLSTYGFIVGRYLRPTARTGVIECADAPPILIDVDDRDDLVLVSQLGKYKGNVVMQALFQSHIRQVRAIMGEKLPRAAHLWLASEDDKGGLAHPSLTVLPNIPYYTTGTAPRHDVDRGSPVILFVGSGGHRPNQAGVARFLQRCWPEIYHAAPNARVRVVGSGWAELAKAFGHTPGLDVVGHVDDLEQEYAKATIAICPVYEGGGTKIKVIEALSFGVPIIAASHSARGFSDELKKEGIVSAETDAVFVQRCLEMLQDQALCDQYAERGRVIVSQTYGFEGFKKRILSDCRHM